MEEAATKWMSTMATKLKPRMVEKKSKITATPYLARQMLKWFYDTSTGAATGASRYGSFVGKGLFGL
jgi:hypothetical protein